METLLSDLPMNQEKRDSSYDGDESERKKKSSVLERCRVASGLRGCRLGSEKVKTRQQLVPCLQLLSLYE